MPQGASDHELVAGCLKGDAVSWSVFVDRFAGLVHWSIRKAVNEPPGGQEEFSKEVFQEFFKRLLEKNELSKLREVEHLRKFLSVMACHLALDRVKSSVRRSRKLVPIEEEYFAQDLPAPREEAEAEEASQAMRTILSELGPKERACLDFYFTDGCTAVETAELLGLTEETVRGILRRAKEKLRARLAEKGFLS